MKKAVLALGLSSVLMFSTMTAFAESPALGDVHKGVQEKAGKMHGLLEQLNLTGDQKSEVKDLMQNSRSTVKDIREQLQANSTQLREAMSGGSVNLDLVKQLADTQGDLMSSLLVGQAELKNQIYALLTPEQQAQLVQLTATLKQEMGKRFGSGVHPSLNKSSPSDALNAISQ